MKMANAVEKIEQLARENERQKITIEKLRTEIAQLKDQIKELEELKQAK
ncbi:MAG: hypothetical protein K2N06_03515 [Oscillospiraceae bacterium]|nr:hypothetical protein [Oscillospiraceae bacterium]